MISLSCWCGQRSQLSSSRQAPVKACIQEGVLPDCPLFHNKLQLPPGGLHNVNIALSILKRGQTQETLCSRRGSISTPRWPGGVPQRLR